MAAKTKQKKSKKRTTRETKATRQARKQMWAVVLFAVGLLMAALTLIKGERAWLAVHNFLFGLFGWGVYFLAPLIIYIAVIAAMDRPLSAIKAKLWQVLALIVMIAGAIQIFGPGLPDEGSLVDNMMLLFEGGKNLRGGGVAGAVFAYPLLALAGSTGGKIIIVLLAFVFLMLITGSSLVSLYHYLRRPVEEIKEVYVEAAQSQKARRAAAPKKTDKPRFNIDVDIGGDEEPASAADDTEEKDTMPGHPVVAAREKEKIEEKEEEEEEPEIPAFLFQKETPVEYISPEEFEVVPEPAVAYDIEKEEAAVRAHPLADEILQAERSTADGEPGGDGGIVANFAPSEQAEGEPEVIDLFDEQEEPPEQEAPETTEKAGPPPTPYRHPTADLLTRQKPPTSGDLTGELKENAQTLVDTLKSFGVQTRITDICRGPAVTRYELQPSAGVKISKITGLADDIALNLASAGIRIEAPIPNKAAVGIEVPNKTVSVVGIRDLLESKEFAKSDSRLTVALGKDIAGNVTLADLGKMPHMLIAGATGSGKSVCINSIIVSLLFKSSPDEVKLLMVDPKVVELGIYNNIPHLLVPVVTDPKKAAGALNWAVSEMQNRYKTFADNSVRDLAGYNRLAKEREELDPMPQIVIIIDELADLMMAAPNDVEDAICRLAQMARAAGMHLVIATQRPSVDVITGVIKANIPSRIAFAVSSAVDSRTILDMGGAEKLLGRGDMLFFPVGSAKPVRIQGCFVTDGDVENIVEFVKQGEDADYDQNIVEEIDNHVVEDKRKKGGSAPDPDEEDEMLPQAIDCVVENGSASTSMLQRRLRLGYARAARIIDQLEVRGIVGPFEGSKPRQVLITKDRLMEMKLSGAEDAMLRQSAEEETAAPTVVSKK